MSDLRSSTGSSDVHRARPGEASGTSPGDDGMPPEPSAEAPVLVVGLGEVGGPLLEVLRGTHRAAGRDIEDRAFHGVQILHLCFPFGPEFVSAAIGYVEFYRPDVVV